MILSNSHLARLTVLTVMVAVTFGCRQETSSFERFVPETILAQASLVSALDAWVAKKPATEPLGQNPKIQLTDRRRATLKLDRYEILGEVSADGARAFAARLYFDGSEGSVGRGLQTPKEVQSNKTTTENR